jgi:SAM-dependent methyltransferase
MTLVGHIDACDWELIRGWAWDSDQPHYPLMIEVVVNDTVVGSTKADQFGEDLLQAGFGDGHHRFRFELGSILAELPGQLHEVFVRVQTTREAVGGPTRLRRFPVQNLSGPTFADAAASHVLDGSGIEIGALDRPQAVPPHVRVQYVDRYTTDRLRAEYPEISGELVHVDIIDTGSSLATVASESCDFVIANNLFEHLEDPVAALVRWTEVLTANGVLFMVVPNRRNSVDHRRPNTPIDHFFQPVATGRHDHYLEWAALAEGLSGEAAERRAEQLNETNYAIHFHVWDELSLGAFLHACVERCDLPLRLEMLGTQHAQSETVVVLRKWVA